MLDTIEPHVFPVCTVVMYTDCQVGRSTKLLGDKPLGLPVREFLDGVKMSHFVSWGPGVNEMKS